MTWQPPPAPGFAHVFAFRPAAVHVPAAGNPFGRKYRTGDWQCVMCRVSLGVAARFGTGHGDDCPGYLEAGSGLGLALPAPAPGSRPGILA